LTVERLASELRALLTELDRAVVATFETSRMRATTRSRGKAAGRRQRLREAVLALLGRRRGRKSAREAS
jgi:hypothetical protein